MTEFAEARFAHEDWALVESSKIEYDRCELVECDLRPVHITGGDWAYVSLRGQDLAGAKLAGLRLREADLTEVRVDLAQAALFAAAHGARVDP